ncbi:MAG: DMT family transporter [Bacteroidota bacterium]
MNIKNPGRKISGFAIFATMVSTHTGEFAALLVAVFWTVTGLAFESATIKVGSIAVNIIRLVMGLMFLSLLTLITRSAIFPFDASLYSWVWLSISGLIGFVIGDLFLFASYPLVGSWFAMLIMTLAPPTAAIFGFLILGEKMEAKSLIGMFVTLAGIGLTIFGKKKKGERFTLDKPLKGILFAFIGALGQGLGIVFSKLGMGDYDPFASTQIRIIAAIIGFSMVISISGRWQNIRKALKHRRGMRSITIGAFFGPFLGVSFSLVAVKHTHTGIASTIMAMVPILIIPPSIIFFKHKISPREMLGAVLGVAGVVLFFI